MAYDAHAAQLDKCDQPYIGHPLRVMAKVAEYGDDVMIVAVLHDVVEDNHFTIQEIENEFGWEIADAVSLLTNDKKHTYAEYIEKIVNRYLTDSNVGTMAILVKWADLDDNTDPVRVRDDPRLKAMAEGRYAKAKDRIREAFVKQGHVLQFSDEGT